jgi:hypothetical protein
MGRRIKLGLTDADRKALARAWEGSAVSMLKDKKIMSSKKYKPRK